MRRILVSSIIGIVLATILLGMSEIVQSASAFVITSKSGAFACTSCAGSASDRAPAAAGFPVHTGPIAFASAGICGFKAGTNTPRNGVVCAP